MSSQDRYAVYRLKMFLFKMGMKAIVLKRLHPAMKHDYKRAMPNAD